MAFSPPASEMAITTLSKARERERESDRARERESDRVRERE